MKWLLLGMALFYSSLAGEVGRAQEEAVAQTTPRVNIAEPTVFHFPTTNQSLHTIEENSSSSLSQRKERGFNVAIDDSLLNFAIVRIAGLESMARPNPEKAGVVVGNSYPVQKRTHQNYGQLRSGVPLQGGNTPPGSFLWGMSNTDNKVTFYTPEIGGLQLGASFAPNPGYEGRGNSYSMEPPISFGIGVASPSYFPAFDQNYQAYSLIFHRPVGELGLSVGASLVTTAQAKGRSEYSPAHNETNAYNVGATISWKGFDLAAGFYDNKKTSMRKSEGPLGKDTGKIWNVEGGYSWGEYAFAVGYLKGKRNTRMTNAMSETHSTNAAKAEIYSLTADWHIAEGLTVYGDLNHARMKAPTTQDREDKAARSETKGTAFLLGTRVNF